ncbi:BAHD acyltransferase DCR [Impatiens glandulifera]|uniref:BAHD acyltransferase DCR n=1 Tax=Impatiens glandulifera TaxID=253017 RepID=UPI001FB055FF|nr:BAHD acyltransferase DCR [Impatiens glandulifera]
MPSSSVFITSKSTVIPNQKSAIKSLKLSISDLPMLSCHYIQKGVLLTRPPSIPIESLIHLLKLSLSTTLTHFPALAGRLDTDSYGHVHIICSDAGVDFVHAKAKHFFINDLLSPNDVPSVFKQFFTMDNTLSYAGHKNPLAAVQVTELGDGIFIGCTVNHAVTDGTSFWNFFNTFAEITKGVKKISKSPDFCRDTLFNSPAVLKFPVGGPTATFSTDQPLRERIFHFSREAILKMKYRANRKLEISETQWDKNGKTDEISSFQSLCAQLWRSVTRARGLQPIKLTTFRMAVNCRHRLTPSLNALYFGNAIQSIPTVAEAGDLLSLDLQWTADLLHRNVVAHDDSTVRRGISDWESNPRLFPLGNPDGSSITMGSSPRFPMYDNDFGWGRPVAVRSGKANKFDGKISAFPGREGGGSVDLEVVLSPETMARLEEDMEYMQYVC